VEASQALFVDDVEENVAAARALGIHGIVHSDWAITRPQIEAWLAGP
jgi:FMN phosphatase YigB (HAD superfamily)